MKRMLLALALVPMANYAMDSVLVDRNLTEVLFNNKESIWNSLPGELSNVLARRLLYNHPVKHYLLGQISLPSKTLLLHVNTYSAEFNNAGTKVVTASAHGMAKIWDAETGEFLHALVGHLGLDSAVKSVKFNGTGDKIVTASSDGTAKVWDAESGECLVTLVGHEGTVYLAQFNDAGDKIVTYSDGPVVKIWDAESGECLATLLAYDDVNDERDVRTVQFNGAGAKIVTNADGAAAKIWDVSRGKCLATLVGHDGGHVQSAQFNGTGDKLVTACCRGDNTAKVWNTASAQCLVTLMGHRWRVYAKFNADGTLVVTRSLDKTAKIWDASSGECLATLAGHTGFNNVAQFNSAGDKIVIVSFNGPAMIWDISPLLEFESFLRRVTLEQAFILNAIYEVVLARARVKIRDKGAFLKASNSVTTKEITLDFNKYPHLQKDYDVLPQGILDILDPYVTKQPEQELL